MHATSWLMSCCHLLGATSTLPSPPCTKILAGIACLLSRNSIYPTKEEHVLMGMVTAKCSAWPAVISAQPASRGRGSPPQPCSGMGIAALMTCCRLTALSRTCCRPRARGTAAAAAVVTSSSSSSSRSSSVDLESSSDEEAASFDPVCAAAHIPEQRGHAQEEAMSLALTIGTWTPGDGCPSLCESARAASGGPPDASSMKLPICGRMEANSRRCWSALLSGYYDVLVATPAELVAGLVHAYIKVPDAALWVFDEAHHTTGDHAYAVLARFLASVEVQRQPRILGLTATPPLTWSQSVDSVAEKVLALEKSFGASLITAPNNDHEALLPTVLEAPLTFAPSQPPVALAEALETLEQSQKTLWDVAGHKQARQLLATQAHLEKAVAMAGQTQNLGAGMVLDESLTNSYHTMATQVSAAMDCCQELGLWSCVASLRHGLLSKVDAKVFSYALEETDEQEGFLRPWQKRRQLDGTKSSNGEGMQRSTARSEQGGQRLYSGSNPALVEMEGKRKDLEARLRSAVGTGGCSKCRSFGELEAAAARRALSNALLALCEAAAPDDTDLYCELAASIDSTFDKHGVLSSVQDGHLADAVATRILQLMPPSHMVQLLLPHVAGTSREHNTESDYSPWADASTMDSTSGWFSTKLKALVPLLVSGQPLSQAQHVPVCPVSAVAGLPKWRGSAMVFAERKATALVMHELMCTLPAYAKNGVKSSPFIGDTNGFASANPPSRMSLNTQRRVMSSFHSGELNMLFATRVGAEGLDFGRCGLVCLFDLPNHVQDYLQCRGRGRLQASLCVRLMEEGHAVSRRKFENLVGDAAKLRSAIAARHRAYLAGGRLSSSGSPIPLEDGGGFTLPATGAHCPPSCAKDILESYCNSLPGNTEYMQLRPRCTTSSKGEGYFSAVLFMPSNSAVLVAKSGGNFKGKSIAKRACALAAVRALHGLQAIDDHLCPVGLALPQDGKPENAALAEKIMHRDMVGTIARVDLEHSLAQVLLPLSHRHPQQGQGTTASHQTCPRNQGDLEARTGTERAAGAPAPEQGCAAAAPPHAPGHRTMQLYGFVLQRTPLPAPHLMGPLGIPVYDDAGDNVDTARHSSGEGVDRCPWPSPPLAPPQSECPPAAYVPMDIDVEEFQAQAACKGGESGKDSSSSSSSRAVLWTWSQAVMRRLHHSILFAQLHTSQNSEVTRKKRQCPLL
uniref:Uncharacterized protein n=1 Tax=Dunaliella tertiolecta TaxID=3047 RepID=A0A7S3VRR8_DUNTE